MQKGPSEIPLYKLVELNISRNVIVTWLIRFHRNAFYGPEINGNPTVYIGNLTFEIRTRAVRHVIMEHTREIPLEQKKTFIKWAIPLELTIFVRKDSVPQKFSF